MSLCNNKLLSLFTTPPIFVSSMSFTRFHFIIWIVDKNWNGLLPASPLWWRGPLVLFPHKLPISALLLRPDTCSTCHRFLKAKAKQSCLDSELQIGGSPKLQKQIFFKLQNWESLPAVFTCAQCSAWLLLCLVVSLKLYSKLLLMMARSVWYHLMFYEKHPDQNTCLGRLKKEKDTAFKFGFWDCFGNISLRDAHCGCKVLKPQHLASRDPWCLPPSSLSKPFLLVSL